MEAEKPKVTASVMVTLDGLVPTLTPSQVEAIQSLISGSVSGLEKENVYVTDTEGTPMESSVKASEEHANDPLALEERCSSQAQRKIMQLLEPRYGQGNVQVSVKSSVDANAVQMHETTYIPSVGEDKGILQSKDEHNVDENSKKSEPAALNSIEGNAEVSTYPNQEEQENASTTADHDLHEKYLVNTREQKMTKSMPEVHAISVAVSINKAAMTPQEKIEVRGLAAKTAGISEDEVVVSNMAYPNITGLDKSLTLGEFFRTPVGAVILILSVVLVALATGVAIAFVRSRKRNGQPIVEAGDLAQGGGLAKYMSTSPTSPVAENVPTVNSEPAQAAEDEGALDTSLFDSIREEKALDDDDILTDAEFARKVAAGYGGNTGLQGYSALGEPEENKEPSLLENVLGFVNENSEIASQFIRAWVKSEE
ncbi:hypothetical protein FACS1894198_2060 [Clostridia bacterium]|nr:hypothetical protein FACS1894198_2060 [Clostridia bacterium]